MYKAFKLLIRNLSRIHPETVNIYPVNGPGIRHGVVSATNHFGRVQGTHGELPSGYPDHSSWDGIGSGFSYGHRPGAQTRYILLRLARSRTSTLTEIPE